jgi:predicted O-methyltransferase YrrM
LRSLLTLGVSDLVSGLHGRLSALDAGVAHLAVEGVAGRARLEGDVQRLREEVAALRAFIGAQGDWEQNRLRATISSTVNMIGLLPHLKIEGVLPSFSHQGFEITGELAAFLFHLVRRQRPRLIFELGSGSSTILFAAAARANGHGRVVSVEHDPVHRDRTAQFLHDAELTDWVTLIETPLTEQEVGGRRSRWYDVAPVLRGLGEKIDIVFVDGPPGKLQPLSRYPALPVLAPHLAAHATILVDDGARDDEMRMIELWRELDISFDTEILTFLPRAPVLLTLPASQNRIAELRLRQEEAEAQDSAASARDRRGIL